MSEELDVASMASAAAGSHLRIKKDIVGRKHYRPLKNCPSAAARFKKLAKKYLDGKFLIENKPARLAFCFVVFDGIVTMADLIAALSNYNNIYTYCDSVCLDWLGEDGRLNRRYLSALTQKAWAVSGESEKSVQKIMANLEKNLSRFYCGLPDNYLVYFLNDAQAWLFENTSGFLFSHCILANPITAIPRSALGRLETSKALSRTCDYQEIKREESVGFMQALGGYFSFGEDKSPHLVEEVVAICKRKSNLPDHKDKGRMIREVRALLSRPGDPGKTTSLIISFVLDLIESGGKKNSNLVAGSIHKYVLYSISQIYEAFSGKELEEIKSQEFQEIYGGIIQGMLPGNRGCCSSALGSWHAFLSKWIGVPPVCSSLFKNVGEIVPNANLIWPHEQEKIFEWLNHAHCDERLVAELKVAFVIAKSVRVRARELFKLRIRSIRVWNNVIEIETCFLKRDGRLKTESSRRVAEINNPQAILIITEWVSRRKEEGASETDLLFGDPHDPANGYKLNQLYVIMNQLVKCVTGDKNVSLHTLCHTVITQSIDAGLIFESAADINPLDMVANSAGHASCQTSINDYYHSFELLLRQQINKGLQKIDISSMGVSAHSTITPECFRRRCSRNKNASRNSIAWEAISNKQFSLLIGTAAEADSFKEPQPPSILSGSSSFEFDNLLDVLADAADGHSLSVVCERNNATEEKINTLCAIGNALLAQLGIHEKNSNEEYEVGAFIIFQMALLGEGAYLIQPKRLSQEKHAPLKNYLMSSMVIAASRYGLDSWKKCFYKGYVSLDDPASATGLVQLLRAASIPIGQLVINVACSHEELSSSESKLLSQIIALFTSIFSSHPHIKKRSPRRGRPKFYLMISSGQPIDAAHSASASISRAGLNTLLLGADIFIKLTAGEKTPTERKSHD